MDKRYSGSATLNRESLPKTENVRRVEQVLQIAQSISRRIRDIRVSLKNGSITEENILSIAQQIEIDTFADLCELLQLSEADVNCALYGDPDRDTPKRLG